MPSLASRLLPLIMTLGGAKRRFSSADVMRAKVARLRRYPARHAPPGLLLTSVDIRVQIIAGWSVYEISPRGAVAPRRALYLHGGAYVYEIALAHWLLVADLAVSTGSRFIVPIYPLAPAETAATIVPKATDLAAALIAEVGAEATHILGDSAGGGMALAVAMQLRDRGLPAPHSTVLISPWLDISGTDPALAVIAPRDPWLAVPGSHAAGEIYRGDLPEDDPIVSPIHGDLTGLGAITMFSGTRDILNADARRLMRLAKGIDFAIDYHEEREMIHVYPLLPIPEGKQARDIIRRVMIS